MNISVSDDYEDFAATYQCLEIARLNEILKERGITDFELRKRICTDYAFGAGYFLDARSFKVGDTVLRPEVCFTEHTDSDNETLYRCSPNFLFHEYAHGDVYWYFDEHNEDASEIEIA